MVFTKTIPRVYLILTLLAAILLSPLPYSALALILLLLQIYCIYKYKSCTANLSLALTFSTLFIIPLILQPLVGGLFAVLLIIPVILLLDHNLREYALDKDFHPSEGRKPTTILKTMSTAIIMVLIVSLILANWTLTFASALLTAYLIAVSSYILYSIPKVPLQGSYTPVRVIAGDTAKVSVAIKSRSKLTLHTLFASPHPWVSLYPARLIIKRQEVNLDLALTPPLSGPTKPQLQALMTDPWGLIQMNQHLKLVEINVIPRARYAEWLAKEFLVQGTLRTTPTVMTTSFSEVPMATRRGVEYLSSHPYHPGDRLDDIDWKRTCKLNELVVKKYSEAEFLFTIVVVNLTVKDAEEADKLAYNLIKLALTIAKASAPSALVVYNHQKVLLTTKIVEPIEILEIAMNLEQDIEIVKPVHGFLQPSDIRQLRRTLTQLEQVKTEPAQKMADFLRLEKKAIQQRIKDHAAAKAIIQVTGYIHHPATIVALSGWNHDAEFLVATLDRLQRHGYNVISLSTNTKRKP